jgi:hypothetical protein
MNITAKGSMGIGKRSSRGFGKFYTLTPCEMPLPTRHYLLFIVFNVANSAGTLTLQHLTNCIDDT